MTKQELVETIAKSNGLTRKVAQEAVETVFESIVEAIASGDKVELRGFGSFKARQRDGRTGRNPKTGEVVTVLPKRVPVFKAGKELKAMVDS
jgi:integration host factor subunit beta